MGVGDDHWLRLVDSLNSAALSTGSWLDALTALAQATGSRSGQLIGLGSPAAVPFNWVSELGSEWAVDFAAHGGGDPQQNPMVRAGATSRALEVVSSAEFVTEKERRRNEFLLWSEREHDLAYICLTPLIKEDPMHVGLAVMRSTKEGEISPRERAVFASIAPHVRAAVRMQMALEHQGALLVAGAMEALALAVFVCDARGKVQALTPSAEALLTEDGALRIRNGKLGAAFPAETQSLLQAIGIASGELTRPGAPNSRMVVVRDRALNPLALDVAPLPRREHAFGFEPRALVIARRSQPKLHTAKELLLTAYALTAAEADVALLLAEGEAPETIAERRGVRVTTVRVQIRSIFAKLGVHRLNELAAKIQSLR